MATLIDDNEAGGKSGKGNIRKFSIGYTRNPHMQTMLRMVGFGDNAGSGFPTILSVWEENGWIEPELKEDTRLNQVTLTLKMVLRKNDSFNAGKQKQANKDKRTKASEQKQANKDKRTKTSEQKQANICRQSEHISLEMEKLQRQI